MYKLYLDDVRVPKMTYPAALDGEWVIVRNYAEFIQHISEWGLPSIVSFDHDLADEHYRPSMYDKDKHYTSYYTNGTFKEKTGYDCAKWLVEYCMTKNIDLPACNVHSANPIGAENISSYLNSYLRSRQQ